MREYVTERIRGCVTGCNRECVTGCNREYVTGCNREYVTGCIRGCVTGCNREYVTGCMGGTVDTLTFLPHEIALARCLHGFPRHDRRLGSIERFAFVVVLLFLVLLFFFLFFFSFLLFSFLLLLLLLIIIIVAFIIPYLAFVPNVTRAIHSVPRHLFLPKVRWIYRHILHIVTRRTKRL